jgi:hypothetical protein
MLFFVYTVRDFFLNYGSVKIIIKIRYHVRSWFLFPAIVILLIDKFPLQENT